MVATIKSEGSKSARAGPGAGRQEDRGLHHPDLPIRLKVRELAATEGQKWFAVIADEAHSQPDREAAAKLKRCCQAEELAELEGRRRDDTEIILGARWRRRASRTMGTYVAFTATPKPKTLELGRKEA